MYSGLPRTLFLALIIAALSGCEASPLRSGVSHCLFDRECSQEQLCHPTRHVCISPEAYQDAAPPMYADGAVDQGHVPITIPDTGPVLDATPPALDGAPPSGDGTTTDMSSPTDGGSRDMAALADSGKHLDGAASDAVTGIDGSNSDLGVGGDIMPPAEAGLADEGVGQLDAGTPPDALPGDGASG